MAVYERTYKRYLGRMTPRLGRFLVLPRYALRDVFASKLLLGFFVLCFVFPTFFAAVIYLRHNVSFLEAFPNFPVDQVLVIDGEFFLWVMVLQAGMAFLLAMAVGPGLISRDLANNGLPLYLSRPVSRWEYVLGKLSVLGILLSPVTWMAGLMLFALQGNLAGDGWTFENFQFATGMFFGFWVLILTVSLLSLALSAWVRWRPVAAFLMFMIVIGGVFFGFLFEGLFGLPWLQVVNLALVMRTVWDGLLGLPSDTGIPLAAAWMAIAGVSFLSLILLNRKIRAYEVVG